MNSFLIPVLWLAVWFPDTGQIAPPPAHVITVYLTHNDADYGHEDCVRMRKELDHYCDFDFKFVHLKRRHPAWVKDKYGKDKEHYPFTCWEGKDGPVYQSGWKGKQAFLKSFNKSRGLAPPAEPMPADPGLSEPIPVTPPEPK